VSAASSGPRWLVACSIVVACAAAGLRHARTHAEALDAAPPAEEVSPLLPFEARCKVHGEQARLHASALEKLAVARWQRVPFAVGEAPRATQLIAEAEACYRAAGERAREARAATLHRRYRAATLRHFAAANLSLHAAPRAELSEQRAGVTRAALATLLALLDGAPADTIDYRERIQRMALAYSEDPAP
jgi:hypothetical protein